MAKHSLTETERWSILNALSTAAAYYRDQIGQPAFRHDTEQCKRLRQQFADQADETMRLYERLEQCAGIVLSDWDD